MQRSLSEDTIQACASWNSQNQINLQDRSYENIFKVAQTIRSRTGLYFPPEKFAQLEKKLDRGLKNLPFLKTEDQETLLPEDQKILEACLIQALTVPHTHFFREAEHFSVLSKALQEKPEKKARIWCAAASSGEEPYSLAMHLLETGIQDFSLLASDINKAVLSHMNSGLYAEIKLLQVPKIYRNKYFTKEASQYRIQGDLRKKIAIRVINLMQDFEFSPLLDAVFCRNVLMYFHESERFQVLKKLSRSLRKDGLLFIGMTEDLKRIPEDLQKLGPSVYRKI